ncbi:MAG: hypothetical protein ACK5F0_12750 [Flavobacteriales bacterium]|jgi:hypothetical protein
MKGQKTGGRIKGTPNKTNAKIREMISNVLSEEMEKLYGSNLTTKERIELVKAVLPYCLPRLNAVSYTEDKDELINPIRIEFYET